MYKLEISKNNLKWITRIGSLLTTLLSPFTNVYNNMIKVHDYNSDQNMELINDWFDGEVDMVTLYMHQEKNDEISMSWHLTPRDKLRIQNALNSMTTKNLLKN